MGPQHGEIDERRRKRSTRKLQPALIVQNNGNPKFTEKTLASNHLINGRTLSGQGSLEARGERWLYVRQCKEGNLFNHLSASTKS